MKRLAAIFVVAAAISGTAPVAATAAPLGGGVDSTLCSAGSPLSLLLVAYC